MKGFSKVLRISFRVVNWKSSEKKYFKGGKTFKRKSLLNVNGTHLETDIENNQKKNIHHS